jgi:hypothetical protein
MRTVEEGGQCFGENHRGPQTARKKTPCSKKHGLRRSRSDHRNRGLNRLLERQKEACRAMLTWCPWPIKGRAVLGGEAKITSAVLAAKWNIRQR